MSSQQNDGHNTGDWHSLRNVPASIEIIADGADTELDIHGRENFAYNGSDAASEVPSEPSASPRNSSGDSTASFGSQASDPDTGDRSPPIDEDKSAVQKSEIPSDDGDGGDASDVRRQLRCACCGVIEARCRAGAQNALGFAREVGEICGHLHVKEKARRCFSVETLKSKIPIIKWLPQYRLEHLQGDLVAGITVGLTVIPQSIAYAQIAGLNSQYGLYSSFVGCFVYALLGTAKDITLGPVAIMSLLVASFAKSPVTGDATYAILVTLIGGCIQLAMGVFCIGFVIEYISHPVINSFTTASAITIMEGQFKKWLGLKKIPQGFIYELTTTLSRLAQTRLWDFLLGLLCLILLHVLKKVKDVKVKNSSTSRPRRVLQYTIWLSGTARNAVCVLLAGAASGIFKSQNMMPFSASNNMPPGLPPFKFPNLTLWVPAENRTIGSSEVFTAIGAGFGIIPMLGVLESIAIAKAFGKRNGYRMDADQELIALGVSNILGSFVSAYPATGSFSRTAVNSQSGVRTPLGGLFTGLLVILSLLFLTPYFNYIPDAALAAVIICAVFDLIDFSLLPKLWRIKKVEVVPWLLTFILCLLLGVEYGIIIGIGVSLLMLLYPWSRPSLKVIDKESLNSTDDRQEVVERRVVVLTVSQGVLFPGIEHLKDKVTGKDGIINCVILDFSHVANIDYTTVEGFDHLLSEFTKAGSTLVVSNPQPHILRVFESAKMKDFRYASSIEDGLKLIKDLEDSKNLTRDSMTELIDGGLLERYENGIDDVTRNSDQEQEQEGRRQLEHSSVV